jgi:hypothetical protein
MSEQNEECPYNYKKYSQAYWISKLDAPVTDKNKRRVISQLAEAAKTRSPPASKVNNDLWKYWREEFQGKPGIISFVADRANDDEKTAQALLTIYGPVNGSPPKEIRESSSVQPPLNAEFVANLLLSHEEREALIGDLAEMHSKNLQRLGLKRANAIFYTDVARSVLPLLVRLITKLSGLAFLGEWVRRITS